MQTPPIISFEGIDCCGKSEQIKRLTTYLTDQQVQYQVLREPGSTTLSNVIRMILKEPDMVYGALNRVFAEEEDFPYLKVGEPRSNLAEALFFLAARADIVEKVIAPTVREGSSIILDRFLDSTIAYQAGGLFREDSTVLKAIKAVHDALEVSTVYRPTKTFFLDIPFETMLERSKLRDGARKDAIERRGPEFYARVIKTYRSIAASNLDRVVLIDGRRSIEDIFEEGIKPVIDDVFRL